MVVALGAALALALGAAACTSTRSSPVGGPGASPSSTTTAHRSGRAGTVAARPSGGCHDGDDPEPAGEHTLAVAGVARSYQLDVPARSAGPAPLVLLFHGFAEDGPSVATYTGLPAQGARAGDVVASPTGTDHTWQFSATGSDATFVTALIAHLEATRCIDLARIYLSGFSAGAAFTLIYTCHHQATIAAVATVAVEYQLGCTQPLPILAFHGTLDPAVPFANGGQGASLPGVAVRGTELNMGDWATLDGCRPTPTDTVVGTEVTRQEWSDCRGGHGRGPLSDRRGRPHLARCHHRQPRRDDHPPDPGRPAHPRLLRPPPRLTARQASTLLTRTPPPRTAAVGTTPAPRGGGGDGDGAGQRRREAGW